MRATFPCCLTRQRSRTPANGATRVGREQSHEALRQDVCGNFVDPNDYRISALNLSNSAAIVLYEALRQTDFQGM